MAKPKIRATIPSMPYKWTSSKGAATQTLHLCPHQSLPARGMAAFVFATFILILIPALPQLGSPVLWALLPFELLAVWGMYFALQHNHKTRQISETLTLSQDTATLIHIAPNGDTQTWQANRYWTLITKHETGGPIPHYVTLKGNGREVEIGSFLSEDERIDLYEDLGRALKR